MTFVDLTKVFDTVSREGLWKIMSKFGCPDRFVKIVRQFHDGMTTRVLDDGSSSEPFQVTNGVKQGCVLAPTLFSLMFSAMLTDAFRETSSGVPIKYKSDGTFFTLRRLQAVTNIKETVIRDLLFADDCAPTPTKSRRCNKRWVDFPPVAITLALPSAPRRPK